MEFVDSKRPETRTRSASSTRRPRPVRLVVKPQEAAVDGRSEAGVTESDVPTASESWYYVVTGENGAGEDPLGQATNGSPRTPATVCP